MLSDRQITPTFPRRHWVYAGINRHGKRVSGHIRAENKPSARWILLQQGIDTRHLLVPPTPCLGPFWHKWQRALAWRPIRKTDLRRAIAQLDTLIAAHMPLVPALELISSQIHPPGLQRLLRTLCTAVAAGDPFSSACAQFPQYFDAVFCQSLAVGEQSGTTDRVLHHLVRSNQYREQLENRIRKSLSYPIAVLGIAGGISGLLCTWVIPQFADLFQAWGAALPPLTQAVITCSQKLQSIGWGGLIGTIGTGMGIQWAYRTWPQNFAWWHGVCLRIPVWGRILEAAAGARLMRALSMGYAAGVPLTDALASAVSASGYQPYQQALESMQQVIQGGMGLQTAMDQAGCFPRAVLQLIGVGEASGTLDTMLHAVAVWYETRADQQLSQWVAWAEPVLLAGVGIGVGILVIAMYLPMMEWGRLV